MIDRLLGRNDNDDFEPYSCRVYGIFKRVKEEFVMLDGTSFDFEYDQGVVRRSDSDIDKHGIYKLTGADFPTATGKPSIPITVTKLGTVRREDIPLIRTEEETVMVAYVEVERTNPGWWEFTGDLNVVEKGEFHREPEDEKVFLSAP